MRNLKTEYRDVADDDPVTALIVVTVMLGVLGLGVLFTGVITTYGEWWAEVIKYGFTVVALLVDWVIWTFVAYTYNAIDKD